MKQSHINTKIKKMIMMTMMMTIMRKKAKNLPMVIIISR